MVGNSALVEQWMYFGRKHNNPLICFLISSQRKKYPKMEEKKLGLQRQLKTCCNLKPVRSLL
jgi:hypothetical protein